MTPSKDALSLMVWTILRHTLLAGTVALGLGCATSAELAASRAKLESLEIELAATSARAAAQAEEIEGLRARQDAIADSLRALGKEPPPPPKPVAKPAPARAEADVPAAPVPVASRDAQGRLILGRQEWLWLDLLQTVVTASLDTGHRTSIIYAVDLQRFERDGREWIAFGLPSESDLEGRRFEARVTRNLRLRLSEEPSAVRRPVVSLAIKLGDLVETVEFVVVEQPTAAPAIVLGRNLLRDIAVIDPAEQFILPKPIDSAS